MAPLGIITIIISAIRVRGPKWLKAIIGRARENTAIAEMELMSSTSEEVCEMFNGTSIVRCQGTAPVWQFMYLKRVVRKKMSEAERKRSPKVHLEFITRAEAVNQKILKRRGGTWQAVTTPHQCRQLHAISASPQCS